MKNYQVVLTEFEDGKTNPECIDLVNVEDPSDRIFANPDDFFVGEFVNEDEFYLKTCIVVNEQSYGSAVFAFRKKVGSN
jgi:hypothetical protein